MKNAIAIVMIVIIVLSIVISVFVVTQSIQESFTERAALKTCLENGYPELESVKLSAGLRNVEYYCIKQTGLIVSVCSLEDVLSNTCK